MVQRPLPLLLVALGVALPAYLHAEGTAQFGPNQDLMELQRNYLDGVGTRLDFHANGTNEALFIQVDILTAGEIINIAAGTDGTGDPVRVRVWSPANDPTLYPMLPPTPGYEWMGETRFDSLPAFPDVLPHSNTKAGSRPNQAAEPEPTFRPILEGSRNTTLASLAGTMRRRGMTPDAIEAALLTENSGRCRPPLPEAEVRTVARSVSRYDAAEDPAATFRAYRAFRALGPDAPPWPEPLGKAAFHGLAGDFVRLVEPHTEADPAALLLILYGGIEADGIDGLPDGEGPAGADVLMMLELDALAAHQPLHVTVLGIAVPDTATST